MIETAKARIIFYTENNVGHVCVTNEEGKALFDGPLREHPKEDLPELKSTLQKILGVVEEELTK